MPRKSTRKKEVSSSDDSDLVQEEEDNNSEYEEEDQVFEVEKIIGIKKVGSKKLYKVVWKGYPISEATWEPYSNLAGARSLIKEFKRKEFEGVVSSKFKLRILSVVHATKKNGDIYYTVICKNNELKEISSKEARKVCPQQVIDYYVDKIVDKNSQSD